MAAHNRRGFTIVELLVVITIIGILMALLFPAINAAREAARRGNCVSNEGQVGKALSTATLTKGKFPKHLAPKVTGGAGWPWVANILPELGRTDIYDAIIANATPTPAGRTERVDILICPSNPPVNPNTPQINYVANAGHLDVDDPNIGYGVFQKTKDVSITDVTDGQSTTLMVAENIDATNWSTNSETNVYETAMIWTGAAIKWDTEVGTTTPDNTHARPSSRHSGGFVVTFCDGHTRFLNSTIGLSVYEQLMTPQGSKVMPAQNTPLTEADLDK